MYFLGINWEIISGSTLLKDDHIVASVSEERFTRNKKEISFPKSAIKYCLQFVDNSKTLDGVGIASLNGVTQHCYISEVISRYRISLENNMKFGIHEFMKGNK